MRKERVHGLQMAADRGREECSRSCPRAIVRICTFLKEDVKHFGLALRRRQNENRGVVFVAQFPIRSLHEKKAHNLCPGRQCRGQQGSDAIPVARIYRGAFAQQSAHAVEITL
jgi:hypothetical protein